MEERAERKRNNLKNFLDIEYSFLKFYKESLEPLGVELNPTVSSPSLGDLFRTKFGRLPLLCFKLSLHKEVDSRKVFYAYFLAKLDRYNYFCDGCAFALKDDSKLLEHCADVISYEVLKDTCLKYFIKEDM